jgi:DNA-binding NtrC family response regulator
VEDLPASVRSEHRTAGPANALESEPNHSEASFDEHEKSLLADALERASGNQSEAARLLRISRDRLRYKMAKYNLR